MNESLKIRGKSHDLQYKHLDKNNLEIQIGDNTWKVQLIFTKDGKYIFKTGDHTYTTYVSQASDGKTVVTLNGIEFLVEEEKLVSVTGGEGGHGGSEEMNHIASPIPGKVVKVQVKSGDTVSKGDPCIIVEAMKMENELVAPRDGVIKAVNAAEGDSVDADKPLIVFEEVTETD